MSNPDEAQKDQVIALSPDEDSAMRCVLTRVQLRHAWDLPLAYLLYRSLKRQPHPGMLRSAFLISGLRTFVNVSIWSSIDDIHSFGGVASHADIVRWSMRRAREIWSSRMRVERLSHTPTWGGRVLDPTDGKLSHAS